MAHSTARCCVRGSPSGDGGAARSTLREPARGRHAADRQHPGDARRHVDARDRRWCEGRSLESSDDAARAPVAVISRSLAARHWRGRSPVGDQVRLAGVGDTLQWRTDRRRRERHSVRESALARSKHRRDLRPAAAGGRAGGRRHRAAPRQRGRRPSGAARGVRRDRPAARSGLRVPHVGGDPEDRAHRDGDDEAVRECFAFALLLAVAGTYGLMSRSIGLRTREIGVRRALGASDAMATRMLLTQGARQLGVGPRRGGPGGDRRRGDALLPVRRRVAAAAGVLVSVAIIAVVLAATWLPTRRCSGWRCATRSKDDCRYFAAAFAASARSTSSRGSASRRRPS